MQYCQKPVTLCVKVIVVPCQFLWRYVPLHKSIEGLPDYVPYSQNISSFAGNIQLIGKALKETGVIPFE